ncbi:unnamed protein product, partial [Oppiella nova]
MLNKKKVSHLVVDSGAFIAGTQIQDLGENMYTLPEVVHEIKDQNTRNRLQFIAYELKYREPSEEDIKAVISFAKKTGDYCQLSATDLKVIALTLRLEKEVNGDKHIRHEPQVTQVFKKTHSEANESMVGFYVNKNDDKSDDTKSEGNCAENAKEVTEEAIESDGEEEEEEEDSDEGWITPHNVEEIRRQMMGMKVDDEVEEVVSVGCLTGDYAMQNVLLQMGLKVINIKDGLRIRSTKQFVLRCFACLKISTKTCNDFCHNCGNFKTLKRVALTVRDDGTKEVHINFKKPINIRGTRYSLPTPKAGKHSNNPILVADQPIPQQRKTKFAIDEKKGHNC